MGAYRLQKLRTPWIGTFQLCLHHRGAASLEPAMRRHRGFQTLGDLASLTSDHQGPDGVAQGRAATANFLRGLHMLPRINKPATPEAGAQRRALISCHKRGTGLSPSPTISPGHPLPPCVTVQ